MTTASTPPSAAEREVWFLTGSQGLYGPGTLAQVAEQSQAIAAQLAAIPGSPVRVVWKPVLTDAAAITGVVLRANADEGCVGLIAW
ncbi:L-arabinose isomerase, partial [Streptomyces sp. NPDC020983]